MRWSQFAASGLVNGEEISKVQGFVCMCERWILAQLIYPSLLCRVVYEYTTIIDVIQVCLIMLVQHLAVEFKYFYIICSYRFLKWFALYYNFIYLKCQLLFIFSILRFGIELYYRTMRGVFFFILKMVVYIFYFTLWILFIFSILLLYHPEISFVASHEMLTCY